MLLYIILVFLIILCLIALSWIWPPDSPWSPRWRTNKSIARSALKLASANSKDIVYELGSGEASVLQAAAEIGAKGVGIEIDPLRFFLSKFAIWRKGLSGKVKIKKGNFFEEDLSAATIVYVYLVPKTLDRLLPMFKKELKKGTRIVSYRYEINLPSKKEDRKNKLRLYVV